MEKIFLISRKQNYTPTLGCYGLMLKIVGSKPGGLKGWILKTNFKNSFQ